MKRMISLALTLALTIGTPAALFAKAPIVKITITGPYLTAPLEITDFKNFDVNVWSGPGVQMNGKEQTEGFIINRTRAELRACLHVSAKTRVRLSTSVTRAQFRESRLV